MVNKLRKTSLRLLRKMRFLPSKIYAHFLYEYYTGKKLNLMKKYNGIKFFIIQKF